MKTKGIVLLCMGHPYYGRYTYNLALSLKYSSPNIDVALMYYGDAISHFTPEMVNVFKQIMPIPVKYITRGKNIEYIRAKTCLYDLSPFDETIYLDADMIWLPNNSIDAMFEQLKDVDFTIQSRGSKPITDTFPVDYSWWANIEEVKKAYEFTEGKWLTLSSEFIYFKRNKEVKKFFDTSKKIYDNLKVHHMDFAGAIPDELVFAIAMIQLNYYSHLDYFCPIYWEQAEKRRLVGIDLYAQFKAYSLGGKRSDASVKRYYDTLASFYTRGIGQNNFFKAQDKSSFLKERARI